MRIIVALEKERLPHRNKKTATTEAAAVTGQPCAVGYTIDPMLFQEGILVKDS